MVPHSRIRAGAAERRHVLRVLRSGHWGPGPEVERLETELARRLGRRHAVAVQSGSAALQLAVMALGRRRVALPSYTCAAVLNAVVAAGARPVLVDVDENGNFAGRGRADASIVPHLFGCPATLPRGRVIEDCAGALGEGLGGRGLLAVTSFYATKLLGAGQGGAVVTDRADLAARIRDLVDYDKRETYRLRFNYRMSDLTAAVARAQLARLSDIVKARRRIADEYGKRLADLPLGLPRARGHQFYRYVVRAPGTADRLMKHLSRRGIEAKRPVFRPLHLYLGLSGFPVTERVWSESVSLPIYPSLTAAEQGRVVAAVRRFFA